MWIYVLGLEQGKFYVGTSHDPKKRIADHRAGRGSIWTRKYKVVREISVTEATDKFEEDATVKRLMSKHGIDNVRGGTYATIFLTPQQIALLQRELWHGTDACVLCGSAEHWADKCDLPKCTQCGRTGHVKSMCYAKTHVSGGAVNQKTGFCAIM